MQRLVQILMHCYKNHVCKASHREDSHVSVVDMHSGAYSAAMALLDQAPGVHAWGLLLSASVVLGPGQQNQLYFASMKHKRQWIGSEIATVIKHASLFS